MTREKAAARRCTASARGNGCERLLPVSGSGDQQRKDWFRRESARIGGGLSKGKAAGEA